MSEKKAKELVSEIMAMIAPAVRREWSHDPQLKIEAEAAIHFTEKAMVGIMKHLFANRLQKAADTAHDFAPFLGSVGAQTLLDIISRLKHHVFDSVRPSFAWAAARAYHAAGDLPSARDRLMLARRLASAQQQASTAARMAIDIGGLAYECNDFERAKYWYEKARQEAIEAKDAEVEAIALHDLASQKLDVDPISARKMLEKSLELKEYAGSSENVKAGSWGNLGILYAKAGDHKKAYDLFAKSVKTFQTSNDYPNLALGLLNLANTNSELDQFREASRLYQKGLRIAKKLNILDTQVLLHQGYATNAFRHHNYRIATQEFRALYTLLSSLGDEYGAAKVLHDLALSLAKTGNRKSARKVVNDALKRFEALHCKDWYRRCLLLIASDIEDHSADGRINVLRNAADMKGGHDLNLKLKVIQTLWQELIESGVYKEATQWLSREKFLLKNDPTQLKTRLHYAGMMLLDKGRKKEALRLLRQVEQLAAGEAATEVANIRQDLAIVLMENGQFGKACDLLSHNIKLARRRKDRILLAVSLGNLGEIKNRAGLHKEAVTHLKEAVRLSRELHDIDGEVLWLNNLSLALSDLNKNSEAEQVLRSALKIAEEASVQEGLSRIWASMGSLSTKIGRFDDAHHNYTAAIESAERVGLSDFAVSMRFNRATSSYHNKNITAALRDAKAVVKDASQLGLYDLVRDTARSAAFWAIEGQRPSLAGEFTGAEFLSNLMVEKHRFDISAGLLLIAHQKLTPVRYRQYYQALKRQLLHSDKSGTIWNRVEQIEKNIVETPVVRIGIRTRP